MYKTNSFDHLDGGELLLIPKYRGSNPGLVDIFNTQKNSISFFKKEHIVLKGGR